MFGDKEQVRADIVVPSVDPRVFALTGMKRGVRQRNVAATEFLLGQETVRVWLSHMTPSGASMSLGIMRRWWAWVELNRPSIYALGLDGLVAYLDRDDARLKDRKPPMKAIQAWVLTCKGAAGTLNTYENRIRSFFTHNDVRLPKALYFKVKPTRALVHCEIDIDDFRMLYAGASQQMRAIATCAVMGGMGRAELYHWSMTGYDSLIEQLDDGERLIRIDLPGRKQNKNINPYYTFIGRDAIKEVKKWLRERDKIAKGDHIFVTVKGDPLLPYAMTRRWTTIVKGVKLALPNKVGDRGYRTGKHLHELRDTFKTRSSYSEDVKDDWTEFFMGHTIDKLGYIKAMKNESFMRSNYLALEPYINLLSANPMNVDKYELAKVKAEHKDDMDNVKSIVKTLAGVIINLSTQLQKATSKGKNEVKITNLQQRINEMQAQMASLQENSENNG